MPINDFECLNKDCGHKFEEIHAYDAIIKCPKCGGETNQLIGAASLKKFPKHWGNMHDPAFAAKMKSQIKDPGMMI